MIRLRTLRHFTFLLICIAPLAHAEFRTLDLKSIVNMDWRDEVWGDRKGGWTDQGDTDMRNVRVGERQLLGIPFELIDPAKNGGRAVLTLKSKKFEPGPASRTLSFGGKARSLYFLHASAWTGGHMATYIVTFEDGASADIPIRAKEEICDWWGPQHGAKYRVAFRVPNAKHDDLGMVIFGWDNPSPEKAIKSIEFRSENVDGIVILAAVTASDKPMSLPDAAAIPLPEYLQSDLETLDKTQWFPVDIVQDKFEPTPIDHRQASMRRPASTGS